MRLRATPEIREGEAAQIVTGIGFLGGGVLLKGAGGVQGTTTAATIWIVAAMGMSVGAGYVPAGIGLAMTIRGVLSLVDQWERMLFGGRKTERLNIKSSPPMEKRRSKLIVYWNNLGSFIRWSSLTELLMGSNIWLSNFRCRRALRTSFLTLWSRCPKSWRSNALAAMRDHKRSLNDEIDSERAIIGK